MSTSNTAADGRHRLGLGAAALASIASTAAMPAGTADAGSTGTVADAGHVHPADSWTPSDNGLIWANYSPIGAGTTVSPVVASVSGKATLHRVLLRRPATISNVLFGLAGVDTGATISASAIGLYSADGVQRALTADISSTLVGTATVKTIPFAAPYAAVAGEYFLALLLDGSWQTTFTFKASGAGVTANAGLAAPHLTLSSLGSGLSALPASLSLASMSTSIITGGWGSQWYGLS